MPGAAHGCKTLDLIKQHGFPKDKRLGAGVVDGRSVYADGRGPHSAAVAIIAELLKKVSSIVKDLNVHSSICRQCKALTCCTYAQCM